MITKKYLDLEGLKYLVNTYLSFDYVSPEELAAVVTAFGEVTEEINAKVPEAKDVANGYGLVAQDGKWVTKDIRNTWGDF